MEKSYRVLLKESEVRAEGLKEQLARKSNLLNDYSAAIGKLEEENAKLLARATEAEKGFEILVDEINADGEKFNELYPKIEALEEENTELLARANMAEHEVKKVMTGCEYWRRRCLAAEAQVTALRTVLEEKAAEHWSEEAQKLLATWRREGRP